MAILAFGFTPEIAQFIEAWFPLKGTLTSGVFFLGFSYLDPMYLNWYQYVVNMAIIAYAITEMT